MPLSTAGLSALTEDECRTLLSEGSWGRVVLSISALPAAVPVNYRVIGNEVVFRTAAGGKLQAALDHAVVAFEIDEHDTGSRTGWSVLVVGAARAITDPAELARVQTAGIDSWVPDLPDVYVAVEVDRISGRRLGCGD